MQVIFRVDSSYNMGTGHVMRCLSLADGLTTQSQAHPKPIFICKNHQGNLSQTIEQRGYQTHLIPNTREPTLDTNTWLGGPWQEDAEATIQIIQNLPQSESQSESEVQWLVIDHYDIHLNWEQKIEETFPQIKLMSIDDYLDRKHAVDVLLNQMYFKNLTKIKNEYRNLMINPKTQLLIGTHYCLLNPIIQKYRKPPNSEVPSLFPTKFKILISLGGCDPENVTLKVIQNLPPPVLGSPPSNLSPSQTQLEYNIVIGSSNQHADSLKAEMKSNPNQINLHQGLSQEEMFQMVSGSSLAIGSIGVSMYERICIGTPTIIITIAENQQAIAQELSQANLVDDLGFGLNFDVIKLQQILMCYYQNPKLLIKRREECQQTCDGRGISRIIKVMEDYIKISNSELKTGCVIQARMTSTRLPGKVLMPIYQEMSMLEVVLRRLKKSQYLDEIIVATTINQTDDPIINLCQNKLKSLNIRTFRGSEQNVLERYYQASKQYKLNTIIRITSDCPLIDPHVLDSMIQFYRQNSLEYDYVSNVINRTYPRGLDTEIFSFQALERAYQTAETQPELEHVTTKILRSPEYSRYAYIQEQNYSDYRLTVDTPEDIELIKEIYSNINKIDFIDITQEEVIVFLSENPKLLEINQDIRQKEVK